jgi:hypothetical protein
MRLPMLVSERRLGSAEGEPDTRAAGWWPSRRANLCKGAQIARPVGSDENCKCWLQLSKQTLPNEIGSRAANL